MSVSLKDLQLKKKTFLLCWKDLCVPLCLNCLKSWMEQEGKGSSWACCVSCPEALKRPFFGFWKENLGKVKQSGIGMRQSFRGLSLQRLKYFKEHAWSSFLVSLGCSWAMLRGEGWPTVARILQRSCSICKKFQKYRRTRKRGRGNKIFGTCSTAYEYSMKRCPVPFQGTGLNINISSTDLVSFNSIYAKKQEGDLLCFQQRFGGFFFYERLQYGPEVGI